MRCAIMRLFAVAWNRVNARTAACVCWMMMSLKGKRTGRSRLAEQQDGSSRATLLFPHTLALPPAQPRVECVKLACERAGWKVPEAVYL